MAVGGAHARPIDFDLLPIDDEEALFTTPAIALVRPLVVGNVRRPISPNRSGQDVYLRALQRFRPEVEVYFGHFLMHRVRAPLAQPLEGRRTVEVIKTEEKGSDVNLAVHLLNDGWLDAYDCSALPKKETVRKYRFANAVVASSRSEAARREPVPVAAVGIAPTLGSPKDYKLARTCFQGTRRPGIAGRGRGGKGRG